MKLPDPVAESANCRSRSGCRGEDCHDWRAGCNLVAADWAIGKQGEGRLFANSCLFGREVKLLTQFVGDGHLVVREENGLSPATAADLWRLYETWTLPAKGGQMSGN